MKTSLKISIYPILFAVILVSSCTKNNKFTVPRFPETPTNLIEFNTEYDDYNSAAPAIGETFPFCFSSNRDSKGENFNIVYKLMSIFFNKKSRELSIYNEQSGNLDVFDENINVFYALDKINTSFNEFGPYLIPRGKIIEETNNRYESYIMLYSTDENQNQDIRFTHNLENEKYIEPIDVGFLNSEFDDLYPSFNRDFSRLYFASNRDGKFNIYTHAIDNSQEIIENLSNNSNNESLKDTVLSSNYDDTCPFVKNNLIVFASNREGGYGGYDLYYSVWDGKRWISPVNFGEKINSEHDEFRPIVRVEHGYKNDIMIFSSNRKGGLGGFDLYYVGINQLQR